MVSSKNQNFPTFTPNNPLSSSVQNHATVTTAMPSNEKQRLEKALGLDLAAVSLDWPQFKKDYGIQHDDPADEAADRAFFTWQRFRGEHRPKAACSMTKSKCAASSSKAPT
jgi:hypothetical protein